MSGKSATLKLSATALDNVVREAECLYQMGEFLEASRLFVEALKGGEHSARAWIGLGVCMYVLGNEEGAFKGFESALALEPDSEEALANLSQVHQGSGNTRQAIRCARAIQAIDPESCLARNQLHALGAVDSLPATVCYYVKEPGEREPAWLRRELTRRGLRIAAIHKEVVGLVEGEDYEASLSTYLQAIRPILLVTNGPVDQHNPLAKCAADLEISLLALEGEEAIDREDLVEWIRVVEGNSLEAMAGEMRPMEPLATVVYTPTDFRSSTEAFLDDLVAQDIPAEIYELVVVLSEEKSGLGEEYLYAQRPFPIRVICTGEEEVDLDAHGRWLVPVHAEDLVDAEALRRRLMEVAQSRPVSLAGENLVEQCPAPVVAVVRGQGRPEDMARCLSSLRRHLGPGALRIICVDDAGEVSDFNHLCEQFPDVEFLRMPTSRGGCRSINAGLAMAALEFHPFVLIMDSSSEVPGADINWLARWLQAFGSPEVGVASAGAQEAIEDTSSLVQSSLQGAVLVRRRALESIGWLMDERLESGAYENDDLCFRLREQGWTCVESRQVCIQQKHQPTEAERQGHEARLLEKYGRARIRRFRKSAK